MRDVGADVKELTLVYRHALQLHDAQLGALTQAWHELDGLGLLPELDLLRLLLRFIVLASEFRRAHLLFGEFAFELVQIVDYLLMQIIQHLVAQIVSTLTIRTTLAKVITLVSSTLLFILLYLLNQLFCLIRKNLCLQPNMGS